MSYDLDWNGGKVLADLVEPFQKANEVLGRRFTREISSNKWDWPNQPSPRDIVDFGTLRRSYSGGPVRVVGDKVFFDHSWGGEADYALPVHEGAIIKNAFGKGIRVEMPARPWTKKPVEDGVLEKAFFRFVERG